MLCLPSELSLVTTMVLLLLDRNLLRGTVTRRSLFGVVPVRILLFLSTVQSSLFTRCPQPIPSVCRSRFFPSLSWKVFRDGVGQSLETIPLLNPRLQYLSRLLDQDREKTWT